MQLQICRIDITAQHQQSIRCFARSGIYVLTIRDAQLVRGRKKVENHCFKIFRALYYSGFKFKMRYKAISFLLERFSVIQDQDFDKKTKTSLSPNEWKNLHATLGQLYFCRKHFNQTSLTNRIFCI